jgi:diguanylate cyclase (GGDEF)-like protein
MRLITRRDTSLAVTLIVGTLIAFERPFRSVLDLIHDLELRYHIDLLPALTLLTVAFVFHQYSKRMQARTEVAMLAQEVSTTRARTEELERLLTFGQALASALDRQTLEQVLWRSLPPFIEQRECSILTRNSTGSEFLVRDDRMMKRHSVESLETLVARAEVEGVANAAASGAEANGDLMFPMVAAGSVVGAIIVHNEPALTHQQRLAIGAAGALIAVATRNARLLHDARQSGINDPLTGCVTRSYGLQMLDRELRRARRTRRPVSLIMFDVDEFKQINDRHGHLQGDAVLASVGEQLNHILRSTDVRCRYGGDEFMVILPDTPILGAQQVAECLRRLIGEHARLGADDVRVTVSLGVASVLPDELDAKAFIGRADEALYRAKRGGRNRWCAAAALTPPLSPYARANSGGRPYEHASA